MSARAPAAALALGTLLALLCAGEARAVAVCSNTPGTGDWVLCTNGMDIDLANGCNSETDPSRRPFTRKRYDVVGNRHFPTVGP